MATWKKVIVSGSTANLAALQVDNLTTGEVVIGGGSGNLSTTAVNGTGNIIATTGASGVSISGSFSGSFQGDGSQLTNIPAGSITGLNLSAIATGSVTASVDVAVNSFTIVSGSTTLFNIRNNGGLEHGSNVTASGDWSHAEGSSTQASGSYSHAEGSGTQAIGDYSHAEGNSTQALGNNSHAEGQSSTASGSSSHAEGSSTQAIGDYSHAEGSSTQASGSYSHAEGISTQAIGDYSHAEGDSTQAVGVASHAEGYGTIASGDASHAEGEQTQAIGNQSHAEGNSTQAIGDFSHAEGIGTIASGSGQHVSGQYNTHGDTTSLFIIGNGADDANRSDIVRVTPTDVQVTGSLNVTGSLIDIYSDFFYVSAGGQIVIQAGSGSGVEIASGNGQASFDSDIRYLADSAGANSVLWNDRQLIKSDGTTVSVDWENGIFSGSFSGSFVGDGSQLTGVVATDLAFALSQSAGITAFTFDGSAPAVVEVSGASTLNSNTVTKWTGNAFANTNITDNGSLVNVNSATTVTGSLNVSGSQVYISSDDFRVLVGTVGVISVDPSNGATLFDTNDSSSIDAQNRLLYDNVNITSIDWNNRQLYKSDGATVAFDWENGQMTGSLFMTGSNVVLTADNIAFNYATDGTTLLQIANYGVEISDTATNPSADFETRQLIKSDGTTVAFDWENGSMTGSLNVTGSIISLDVDEFYVNLFNSSNVSLLQAGTTGVQIWDTNGNFSIDAQNRLLYDNVNSSSIDWNGRQLIDSASAASVEWNQRYLNDGAGNNSIAWDERKLIKSDGTTVSVDWENGIFSGSFSGSFQGDGSQLTGIASTLSGSTDSGNFEVDLLTQYLTIQGTVNEIETSASGQTITIGLPNDVTIGNTLTVQGDLIVNGTTTVINTTNTAVEDQFILLASGSTSTVDAGIIVQNAANAGEAFYWENNPGSVGRWAIASNIAPTATTVTAAEYMVTAVTTAGAPAAAPTYGGATTGYGNIHVNSVTGDIYIYA